MPRFLAPSIIVSLALALVGCGSSAVPPPVAPALVINENAVAPVVEEVIDIDQPAPLKYRANRAPRANVLKTSNENLRPSNFKVGE